MKAWNALKAEREALKRWQYKDRRERVQQLLQGMTRELKGHPPLEAAIRRRQQELGIEPQSRLSLEMAEKDLKNALSLSPRDIDRDPKSIGLDVKDIYVEGTGDSTTYCFEARIE